MDQSVFLKKFSLITDPNTGKNVVELGLIEEVEVNEDMKRVYVTLKGYHHLTGYIEESVRGIVSSSGYDPEIEIIN